MANAKKTDELGSLKKFGIEKEWQVPLLMPRDWERIPLPMNNYPDEHELPEKEQLIELRLTSTPEIRTSGTRRVTFTTADKSGRMVRVTAWGSGAQSEYARLNRGDSVIMKGKM